MNIATIETLAAALKRHGLERLIWREGDDEITLTRHSETQQPTTREPVTASCVGQLLWQHPSNIDPALDSGTSVAEGQTLAWIAVGPLLRPVHSAKAGTLLRELADGTTVGYGQTLAFIESTYKD